MKRALANLFYIASFSAAIFAINISLTTASHALCTTSTVFIIQGFPTGSSVNCPSGTEVGTGNPISVPDGSEIFGISPSGPNTTVNSSLGGFQNFNGNVMLTAAGGGGGTTTAGGAALADFGIHIFDTGQLDNSVANLPGKTKDNEVDVASEEDEVGVVGEEDDRKSRLEDLNDILELEREYLKNTRQIVQIVEAPASDYDFDRQIRERLIERLQARNSAINDEIDNLKQDYTDFYNESFPDDGTAAEVARLEKSLADNPPAESSGTSPSGSGEPLPFFPGDGNRQNAANHQFTANFETGNSVKGATHDIWSRLKFSNVDGAGGFDGYTFHGMFGVVTSIDELTDFGIYASAFTGDIDSSQNTASLESTGIGAGVYIKRRIDPTTNVGLGFDYQRSQNDISSGGTTGSFDRDRFEFNASLDNAFSLNGIDFSRIANFRWLSSDRDGYTDSGSNVVAGSTEDTAVFSLALNMSKKIEVDHENIVYIVPSAGAAINFNLNQLDDFTFADGSTFNARTVTADVNAGVTMKLASGGTLNVTTSFSGIGGDVTALGGSVKLAIPLD